jgi:putative nucleotidyltransferase with HDIG domain
MKKYSYKEVVKSVEKIVEKQCKKNTNIYGYDAWRHHIIPVIKFSKILAKNLGANKEIVELSALLHDVGSIKGDRKNHHISGMKEAEKILKKFDYPQEKIEKIKHCIYTHRGSKKIKRESIEAECLASADVMAHFKDLPSLFHLVFKIFKMDTDEGMDYLRGKIERDWQKLIPQAKKLVKKEYKAIKLILK